MERVRPSIQKDEINLVLEFMDKFIDRDLLLK